MKDLVFDLLVSIPLFAFICVVMTLTSHLKNVWRNRKYIHFSSIPAILAYMYVFKEPFVFFFFSILFTVILLYRHKKNQLFKWFQQRKNKGEVWFTLSFAFVSLVFWFINRTAGGLIMLFMAAGDGVTGIIRSFFVKKRQKHLSGTIGMIGICSILGYAFLGIKGVLLAVVASICEYQRWIDDNLAIPLFTSLAYFLITMPFSLL